MSRGLHVLAALACVLDLGNPFPSLTRRAPSLLLQARARTSANDELGFDICTATVLAGFAFDAYNEPGVGKVAKGEDQTVITFTSSAFIWQVFEGVIFVTLRAAQIKEGWQSQQQILEKVATGGLPDPYVNLAVLDSEVPAMTVWDRVIDTAQSSTKQNTFTPEWRENYFLYVRNRTGAVLNVSVLDKNIFSSDELLGAAKVSVVELQRADERVVKSLPVPIYLERPRGWFDFSSRPKLARTGTCALDLEFIPWQAEAPDGSVPQFIPGGASAEADWRALLRGLMTARRKQRVLNLHNGDDSKATLEDALHQACSIENPDTDTQAGLFLDASSRKLVVSFRGTEQAKLRDLLTDINFLQTAFYGGTDQSSPFAGIKCHTGFLSAYLSVRSAVLQLLETTLALDDPNSGAPWSVFITGHSLGGALATLLLFDLEMLRGHGSGVVGRHSALLKSSEAFVERLQTTLVQCYTFGAPRVGNREFAETLTSLLQARSDVRSLYRVVNKADVVARLPRSSRVNSLVEYEHVGKTVLVDENAGESVWIEGSSTGACPLLDLSPFAAGNRLQSVPTPAPAVTSGGTDFGRFVNSTVGDMAKLVDSYRSELGLSSSEPIEALLGTLQSSTLRDNLLRAVTRDASKTAERLVFDWLDQDFVTRELALLQSLIDGRALDHHLEPSYFLALKNVVASSDDDASVVQERMA